MYRNYEYDLLKEIRKIIPYNSTLKTVVDDDGNEKKVISVPVPIDAENIMYISMPIQDKLQHNEIKDAAIFMKSIFQQSIQDFLRENSKAYINEMHDVNRIIPWIMPKCRIINSDSLKLCPFDELTEEIIVIYAIAILDHDEDAFIEVISNETMEANRWNIDTLRNAARLNIARNEFKAAIVTEDNECITDGVRARKEFERIYPVHITNEIREYGINQLCNKNLLHNLYQIWDCPIAIIPISSSGFMCLPVDRDTDSSLEFFQLHFLEQNLSMIHDFKNEDDVLYYLSQFITLSILVYTDEDGLYQYMSVFDDEEITNHIRANDIFEKCIEMLNMIYQNYIDDDE